MVALRGVVPHTDPLRVHAQAPHTLQGAERHTAVSIRDGLSRHLPHACGGHLVRGSAGDIAAAQRLAAAAQHHHVVAVGTDAQEGVGDLLPAIKRVCGEGARRLQRQRRLVQLLVLGHQLHRHLAKVARHAELVHQVRVVAQCDVAGHRRCAGLAIRSGRCEA